LSSVGCLNAKDLHPTILKEWTPILLI
jgi:hypothetical protein